MKRILLLTGRPGVGKTTVLQRVIQDLSSRGYDIGGMITREVREGGARIGFEIEDLTNGRRGWLARVDQPFGPRVGKYKVNLKGLDSVGARAILDAVHESDVIVIDEIGPMELCSSSFREAVKKAVNSNKPILGTVHYRARNPLIESIKKREDAEIIEVTVKNRDSLYRLLVERITDLKQR